MFGMNRGFTIIELLISIAIFVAMTALVVAKYGNFNQSTLLTDTAYDIALVMRLAQTYGLSVKNAGAISPNFNFPYGVSFDDSGATSCGTFTSNETNFVLFADSYPLNAPDGICASTDTGVSKYAITRGAKIVSMCTGSDQTACRASGTVTKLNVSYQRPNPDAVICGSSGGAATCSMAYAEITIQGTDGSRRTIVMRQNGQISVEK